MYLGRVSLNPYGRGDVQLRRLTGRCVSHKRMTLPLPMIDSVSKDEGDGKD